MLRTILDPRDFSSLCFLFLFLINYRRSSTKDQSEFRGSRNAFKKRLRKIEGWNGLHSSAVSFADSKAIFRARSIFFSGIRVVESGASFLYVSLIIGQKRTRFRRLVRVSKSTRFPSIYLLQRQKFFLRKKISFSEPRFDAQRAAVFRRKEIARKMDSDVLEIALFN